MKVSCICPTMASRADWLPRAIECFRSQHYPNKEMIIVADHGMDLSRVDGVVVLRSAPGASIGEKRNAGCRAAAGLFIAHFDDDDLSFPGRLTGQIARLRTSGKAVTGYHSMPFSNGAKRRKYNGTPDFALDTSLCYRREFWDRHQFADLNDGAEAEFKAAAVREGQFISVDGTGFMEASIHPGNTTVRDMTPGNSTWTEL